MEEFVTAILNTIIEIMTEVERRIALANRVPFARYNKEKNVYELSHCGLIWFVRIIEAQKLL